MLNKNILELKNISKKYDIKSNFILKRSFYTSILDNISLYIKYGESLGLVGESGSGKTTLAKIILKLIPFDSGQILFMNRDISNIREKEFKKYRRNIQMIFQDPYGSLNPRMTVEDLLSEPLIQYNIVQKNKLKKTIIEIIDIIGLSKKILTKYPHEFSGGQRQRIAIARAISIKPKLLIADEPVSALDVSVQAQILNLLLDIKKEFNLSLLFISHNLAVVKYICDNIAIIHKGKIIENKNTNDLFNNPSNEYTKELLSSVPGRKYNLY